ncbi:helix-turn-helix domain-containing protein [Azospirillum sp.]|uniref:helix-turn-helix domain-containing protein n=1 Tax=Azospirillum sp. TaxID=34012 RepID=UPI002D602375|nr:helix-turn-helix domain-containing protein [Azospirillum sp.]HYD70063.1 helix-turn-helix domain-containing protein [Azospirillum sp.]
MTTSSDDAPFSDTTLAAMRPMPLAKRARIASGLSQEAFAERYGIPVGTLREWEQRRREPEAAAASYLKAIANDPDAVAKALTGQAA